MDDALVEIYLHQHVMGNRVRGTFAMYALENIVIELKSTFQDKSIDKERLKTTWKI